MSSHYYENASTGSQYYFNNSTTSSSSQSNPSGYSSYPHNFSGSYSPNQTIRLDNSYQNPQNYQSTAGFNRNVIQQHYSKPQSPTPQVRASVRIIGSQEQYSLPTSSQPRQASPQQHHFQFDSRQQPGHATGPAVVYQTPGAAQFTHRNVDLWTEGPSQGQDHYVQAQRVSVRPVTTGSPQQSHSVSPQRHPDHLQQYYNQLTPEQHQQLLRQQQLQRQQEQTSHYEQQQGVTIQQISPSTQHRSTAGFNGGGQQYQQVSPNQQGRGRPELDRQRQEEQGYYAAQRQMAAQRAQQYQQEEEPSSHPVGIRNLMTKFDSPTPRQQVQPRSRSTSSRNYSSSSYTTHSGPTQTTSRTLTSHSMTYSALPKPHEPPVNSHEYYQMQLQQGGNHFGNIQQAAAPAHIQHTPAGFGAVRDRFKTGSLSEDFNRSQVVNRQPPPQQQQYQQQQQQNAGGSSLSSIRNQYMTRAQESLQNDLPPPPVQNISRTIVGEDIPQQKQAPLQQPAPVLQAPQQPTPVSQPPEPESQPPEQQQQQAPVESQEQPQTETTEQPTSTPTADGDEGVSSF